MVLDSISAISKETVNTTIMFYSISKSSYILIFLKLDDVLQ